MRFSIDSIVAAALVLLASTANVVDGETRLLHDSKERVRSGEKAKAHHRSYDGEVVRAKPRQKETREACPLLTTIQESTTIPSDANGVLTIPDPQTGEDVSIIEVLNDIMEESTGAGLTFAVITGDEVENESGCGGLDFISASETVLVMGGTAYGAEFCAAINPCNQLFAMAQDDLLEIDLLPPQSPVSLVLSLDSLGISVHKSFEMDTLNPMWDGNTIEIKTIEGHFLIAATAELSVGVLDFIEIGVYATASLIINADPKGNGVLPVSFDHSVDVDFEFLASLLAAPYFEINSIPKPISIDLEPVLNGKVDFHTLINDGEYIEAAASVNANLNGYCDLNDVLKFLCGVFLDKNDSYITGAVYFYANAVNGAAKTGFRFELQGEVQPGELWDALFGFDLPSSKIDFIYQVKAATGERTEVCTTVDGVEDCELHCAENSHCGNDHYCHPIWKVCIPDQDNGYFMCTEAAQCKSGYCVAGTCRECPTIDSSEGCGSNEFCAGLFHECQPKRAYGQACLSSNVCQSGLTCPLGFCRYCDEIDSLDGCPSGQFCSGPSYICADRRGFGGACLHDNACESGLTCFGGFCRECTVMDSISSSQCPSGKFCNGLDYGCDPRRGEGGLCLSDNACASGLHCVAGFCRECREIDTTYDCPAGKFCAGLGFKCENQRNDGQLCSSSNACKDMCVAGFCQECTSDSHCGSNEYCYGWPVYDCKTLKSKGSGCGSGQECKSGTCSWWKCT